MRYSKFTIALLCLCASNSYAIELITATENQTVNQIEQKFEIDNLLISINDRLSNHKKSEYDYDSLLIKIENEKENYNKAILALPNAILTESDPINYFKGIETLVKKIDSLEKKSADDEIKNKENYQDILKQYEVINSRRAEKSAQLFTLKKEIVNRIVTELSSSDSVKSVDLESSMTCSKFQSINECLKDTEKYTVKNTINSDPFLSDKSVLLSYKVIDASMNMNGELHYKVNMTFKPSYNNKIESLLNEKLGLKSTVITLTSNVDADWYVDGTKVGTGKKIHPEVTLGKHGIVAIYKTMKKSTIETVETNAIFNYKFGKVEDKSATDNEDIKSIANVSAAEETKSKQTKPKLTMYANKEDSTSKEINSKNETTVDNSDKNSYEYYLGIKPLNKEEQDKQFKSK
ncbi:hypothetical protein [Shewanella baltica]|uniref:hypothetical protein n=1 Tax=Shewanella baltica TaxID=62322 RepID=UPI00217DDC7D|nr:hypothetical protein [Shewanella baltica]MCS6238882.1 hypothetical protein [Shewanella baltica]